MNIAIILSGVLLANKEPNKVYLENITGVKVVEQYKIIPNEVIKADKELIAKKKATKKSSVINGQKKKKVKKSTVKSGKKTKQSKKIAKKVQKKKIKSKKVVNKRVRYNVGEIQSYAHQRVLEYDWSEEDYQALVLLWYRESSWNPNAYNKSSGACGIPQSKPCSKMSSFGADYLTNYKTQVNWGLDYIKNKYGTPSEAYRKFLERKPHWY